MPQLWQKWQMMRAHTAGLLSSRPQGIFSTGACRHTTISFVSYASITAPCSMPTITQLLMGARQGSKTHSFADGGHSFPMYVAGLHIHCAAAPP